MISEGQIVLFKFPQTDQEEGKLRPSLVLRKLPGKFNNWLICMVSSKIDQQIPELDELVTPEDSDFIHYKSFEPMPNFLGLFLSFDIVSILLAHFRFIPS